MAAVCLPQQTLSGTLVASDFRREELDGYFSAESLVLSEVNLAHAAATEFSDDEVMRDGLADHWS